MTLDASVRLGETTKQIPKATNGGANQYKAKSTVVSQEQKTTDTVVGGFERRKKWKTNSKLSAFLLWGWTL